MNLEQMRYIVEVARTGSLTQAAQNLHISLSAISQAISLLESELGIPLFTRSRGIGAIPTPEGLNIIEKANEIMIKVEEIKEEAQIYSNTLSGQLKIATIPGPIHLLVNTVASFKKDFPKIKIEITEKGTQEIFDDILNHHIDLGFVVLSDDLIDKQKELSFHKVLEGKLVLGVNRYSRLSLEKKVTPKQLSGLTLVLYDDEFIRTYVYDLIAQHSDVSILFITNNTRAIHNAVKQGIAATIGLDYSFPNSQSEIQQELVTIDLELPLPGPIYYGLVHRKDRTSSHIINRFLNRLDVRM